MKCNVLRRYCLRNQCSTDYTGEQDCLHFWTKETGICDEVGWDFFSHIMESHATFSAYCSLNTKEYQSIHHDSAPFVSAPTFIKWFFSWAASLKIDFRKDVDKWCPNRKVVAADGTHLGPSVKQLKVQPINSNTCSGQVETNHKVNDRCFLNYKAGLSENRIRDARAHLLSLCNFKELDHEYPDHNVKNNNLLDCCPSDERCKVVVKTFIEKGYTPVIHSCLSDIFKIIAKPAPVSAFLPLRFEKDVLDACSAILDPDQAMFEMSNAKVRSFAPELAALLRATWKSAYCEEIAKFIAYLREFAIETYKDDAPYVAAVQVPDSYNPESGVAYYFTPHGCRVRDTPIYKLNSKNDKKKEQQTDSCTKNYPRVAQGGYGYTFFFFCPIHGHCLGFHIIDGSEGRKDCITPLHTYMPEPPNEVFYDFACSASEYSLNREPAFFKRTRFFHDIFHSYNHKCASTYQSSRIGTLQHVDSEICEQFNAFVGRLTHVCSHLSQSHFCFLIQLMIYGWNKRKTERITQLMSVAANVNV